jgi:hypothetical protein
VNGTLEFIGLGATLLGSVLSDLLGAHLGLRATLLIGVCSTAAAALWLALSPIRRIRTLSGSPLTMAGTYDVQIG